MPAQLTYDHYKVLGLQRGATSTAIKHAFRVRVKQCHPDRDPSPGAHLRFLIVHEAYAVLSDPLRRSEYDQRLFFYRTVRSSSAPHTRKAERPAGQQSGNLVRERPVPRFAFYGLHVTGLVFGCAIVSSVLVGIAVLHWPVYALIFSIPGAVVIPDSWQGLRMK